MTLKYPRKRSNDPVAREGVNFVRGAIEGENCIFHEINQQNDFGNDAFVELVEKGNVKGITIAVQIKSGTSFVRNNICSIPASKKKFTYWSKHSLPVIGIVYDPSIKNAYWVNLSS